MPQEATVAAETGPVVKFHLVGASVRVRLRDLSEVSPPSGVQVLDDNLVAQVQIFQSSSFLISAAPCLISGCGTRGGEELRLELVRGEARELGPEPASEECLGGTLPVHPWRVAPLEESGFQVLIFGQALLDKVLG